MYTNTASDGKGITYLSRAKKTFYGLDLRMTCTYQTPKDLSTIIKYKQGSSSIRKLVVMDPFWYGIQFVPQ
jgi:hypothetical protein